MAISNIPCASFFGLGRAQAPAAGTTPPPCPIEGVVDSFAPTLLESPLLKPFSRGFSTLFPGSAPEPPMAWGAKLDESQRDSVRSVARAINAKPDDLMNVIAVETGGSFDPAERANGNSSGAVGLIQFTDTAIEALNNQRPEGAPLLSKKLLEKMSFSQQMEGPVLDYFRLHLRNTPSPNAGDLYTAVLAPAAVGRPDSHVVYRQGRQSYDRNASVDSNSDGKITRGEIVARLGVWAQQGPENAG